MRRYFSIFFLVVSIVSAGFAPTSSAKTASKALDITVNGLDSEMQDNVLAHIGKVKAKELKNQATLGKRLSKGVRAGLSAMGYFSPTLSWSAQDGNIVINVDAGKPTKVTASDIKLVGDGAEEDSLQALTKVDIWQTGAIFNSDTYDSAKSALMSAARAQGYLTAVYSKREVIVDPNTYSARIALTFETGPLFHFGKLTLGENRIDDPYLEAAADWPKQTVVSTGKLSEVQQNLLGTGYFSSVLLDQELDRDEALVDVNAEFAMKKKHIVTAGIGYGTDTGPRVKLRWIRPWLNSLGHSLQADAYVSAIGNSIGLRYKIPTLRGDGAYWEINSLYETKKVKDTDSKTFSTSAAFVSALPWGWKGSAYLKYLTEEFTQGKKEGKSQLLMPGVSATKKRSDDTMNPTHGYKYTVLLDAASKAAASDANFFRLHTTARWLKSWGRSSVLTGLELGGFYFYENTTLDDIPASMRFFAGGDNSIRGYSYQSISPRDENGDLSGGQYLLTTRLEYRYQFLEKWRASVFVDAGNAFGDQSEDLFYGPGIGVAWLSPVGPIRIDLGVAASDDNSIELHIGLGPEL